MNLQDQQILAIVRKVYKKNVSLSSISSSFLAAEAMADITATASKRGDVLVTGTQERVHAIARSWCKKKWG